MLEDERSPPSKPGEARGAGAVGIYSTIPFSAPYFVEEIGAFENKTAATAA